MYWLLRRLIRTTALVVLLIVLMAGAAYAAFQANLVVIEGDGNAHTMLGCRANMDNTFMAANGYMDADGRDTLVTLGGTDYAHMPREGFTHFAVPVTAHSTTTFEFTTGNTPADMSIVPGDGGYVTTPYAVALEPGDTFEFEYQDTFVDTAKAQTFVGKPGAFQITQSGGTLLSAIPGTDELLLTVSTFGNWHVIDLSAYAPSGASGVVLHIEANLKDVAVRETGGTDNRLYDTNHVWTAVGLDASVTFELYIEDNTVVVYVVGYTDSTWGFFTNDYDKSVVPNGAYTDVDCSVECPAGTEAVIIEVLNLGVASTSFCRENGSGDNRVNAIAANLHQYIVVGVDGAVKFEQRKNHNGVDLYLMGYMTNADATHDVNGTDYSLAGVGVWTDIDLTPSVTLDATFAFIDVAGAPAIGTYGLKMDGSAVNLQDDCSGQSTAIVRMDTATDIIEGIISNVGVDFWYKGCAETSIQLPFGVVVSDAIITGEYDIEVVATGGAGDLELWVNSVLVDFMAMGGNSVFDNGSDWDLMTNVPYAASYREAVGGVDVILYQPDDIIAGTVLPDREGAAQDGAFTFGSNPAGVLVNVGPLVIVDAPQARGAATVTPSGTGVLEQPDTMHMTDTEMSGSGHEFYSFLQPIAGLMGVKIQVVWWFGAGFLSIVFLAVTRKFCNSVWLAGLVAMIVSAAFVAMGGGLIELSLPIMIFLATAFAGLWQRETQF